VPESFKRGELKQAIVAVLAALGEAHGYAIMGELKERVGGRWRPSPGAILSGACSRSRSSGWWTRWTRMG